ncbi:MAG: hypothetical protein CM15mV81_250 [uncultured marine virus]|nr:MAG: hypothetical protein CM15mV81_250 [uncultured marine virus]
MYLRLFRTQTLVRKFMNHLWILAIGTGVLHVEEGDAVNPINFTALPLPHVVLDVGPDDRIDHVYRERDIRYSDIMIVYIPKQLSTLDCKML